VAYPYLMCALQVVIQLFKEPRRLPRGSYLNELYPNLCESSMSDWCSKEVTINHLCKGPLVDVKSLSIRDDHTLWIIRYGEMSGKSINGLSHQLTWCPISNNDQIHRLNLPACVVIASILSPLSSIQVSEIITKDEIEAIPNRSWTLGPQASEMFMDRLAVL
jgi:hypothetical protein